MNLPYKSKKLIKLILVFVAGLLVGVIVFWSIPGTFWKWDFLLLRVAYLPIGFVTARQEHSFKWHEGVAYEQFRTAYLKNPIEQAILSPFMQRVP
jgi:hypothetical protein